VADVAASGDLRSCERRLAMRQVVTDVAARRRPAKLQAAACNKASWGELRVVTLHMVGPRNSISDFSN
jgi:hypothetical protein